jgi:hypothetical protein
VETWVWAFLVLEPAELVLEPEDEPQPASRATLTVTATIQPAREIRVDVIMTSVRRPSDLLISPDDTASKPPSARPICVFREAALQACP